ncbi:MAG TPA: M23 family metallopeptidase [Roseiarcus sp.]|jgi:septal ring factor EnvC (AmiA/AmiB activator)
MFQAIGRSAPYGLGALALVVAAPLACAPAVACPQTQVAEAAFSPASQAAQARAELKFDWPVRGRIVHGCGIEDNETITIAAGNGAEVRAALSGVVAFAGELKRYGNVVLIKHQGGFVSAYHGDIGDLRVKRRDSVRTGQAIGAMRAPEGEMLELHFELRRDDKWIDPRPLMTTAEPPFDGSVGSLSAK